MLVNTGLELFEGFQTLNSFNLIESLGMAVLLSSHCQRNIRGEQSFRRYLVSTTLSIYFWYKLTTIVIDRFWFCPIWESSRRSPPPADSSSLVRFSSVSASQSLASRALALLFHEPRVFKSFLGLERIPILMGLWESALNASSHFFVFKGPHALGP